MHWKDKSENDSLISQVKLTHEECWWIIHIQKENHSHFILASQNFLTSQRTIFRRHIIIPLLRKLLFPVWNTTLKLLRHFCFSILNFFSPFFGLVNRRVTIKYLTTFLKDSWFFHFSWKITFLSLSFLTVVMTSNTYYFENFIHNDTHFGIHITEFFGDFWIFWFYFQFFGNNYQHHQKTKWFRKYQTTKTRKWTFFWKYCQLVYLV